MDEDRFFYSSEDTQFADTGEKPLTRAQKKNARKKQKKKDKKSTDFAFEIEEITTGFEDMTLTGKEKVKTCIVQVMRGCNVHHTPKTQRK